MNYSNRDSYFYHKAAFDAIYNSYAVKGSNTFAEWHKRAREAADAVKQTKADYDREIEKMRDTWAEKVIAAKRADYDADHKLMVSEAKERIMTDFDRVADAKRAQLAKSLGAPSQDAVNLLTVLSMRTTLTPGEIAAIVPQLAGNLQALKVLSEIASRSGISFPKLPSAEQLDDDIMKIREFAENVVESIASDWNYSQLLFWTTDFAGLVQEQMDALDDPSFLQIDAKEIGTANKETASGGDEHKTASQKKRTGTYTKLTLNGSEYIDTIAREFGTTTDEIKAANPGVDLLHFASGTTIIIPGTLVHPEDGTGHVNEWSHEMTVVEE